MRWSPAKVTSCRCRHRHNPCKKVRATRHHRRIALRGAALPSWPSWGQERTSAPSCGGLPRLSEQSRPTLRQHVARGGFLNEAVRIFGQEEALLLRFLSRNSHRSQVSLLIAVALL